MEDKGSHGTFNESDIKELFERRHVLDKLQKKGKVLRSIVPICREVINDVQSLRFLEDSVTNSQGEAQGNQSDVEGFNKNI